MVNRENMIHLVHLALRFISAHSAWALPVIFIVTFGESFAIVSLFFPGTAIMVAAGLLVANGTLPLGPVLIGGIAGAVVGDGVSYWLGWRYGTAIAKIWPFSRSPALLGYGEAFFKRFGSLSVFIGRFLGPFRATVPLVAGIVKMRPMLFWLSNIASAFVWAPVLLLPGVVAVTAAEWAGVAHKWKFLAAAGIALVIASAVWFGRKSRLDARLKTLEFK